MLKKLIGLISIVSICFLLSACGTVSKPLTDKEKKQQDLIQKQIERLQNRHDRY